VIIFERPTGQLVLEPTETRLARCANPADLWLHCDWCNRFFQHKSLAGSRCPFDDCSSGDLFCGIYFWDDLREPDDPRWPTDTTALFHGMRAPDMEPFYARKRDDRISAVVRAFAASAHADALDGGPRFARPFLKMMADLDWDLTAPTDAGLIPDLALELIDQLPVWSKTSDPAQAPRMLAELRALFGHAAETDALPDADGWLALLADGPQLLSSFTATMANDPRLQPDKRATSPAPRPRDKPRAKKRPRRSNRRRRSGRKRR